MERDAALSLIDQHKNGLSDPVAMLHWTWLRVVIVSLDEDAWEAALDRAAVVLAR